MADGVDHIDIYADVGEEFNQVREGPGPRRRSGGRCGPDAGPGPAAGCEPAPLQTVRFCRRGLCPRPRRGAPLAPRSTASFRGPRALRPAAGPGARPRAARLPPLAPPSSPPRSPLLAAAGGRFPPR